MAKVQVDYEYQTMYRAIVEIPDTDIADVLEEWKQDNEEGWEPGPEDVAEAIELLMENDEFNLDPTCDEEIGWGETTIENWHVTEPYILPTYAELHPEVPGQVALIALTEEEALDQIHMGEGLL